ncbi:NAD-glutamate dehydrogenase [Hankyongella ginsenosidimutans]|uniref:NAD-glutamate dehydrogenase n=1 Tax=Hankyongella ginsenosidimutans TaxID=1763828 RepID=A0A4D7C8W9_9SPHN|nr:NAD-glutamate dehydrogenase [Hankyongella ginsenosidimutans]
MAFMHWCSPPASRTARSAGCAPIAAICARLASPTRQRPCMLRCAITRARRRSWSRCSRCFSGTPDSAAQEQQIVAAFEDALTDVSALDDDRILRRFLAAIRATVRTNAFQDPEPEALAFKIRSAEMPDLPPPVPYMEIFVHSPRVEGIHLRGGKVARGGLRWSDRRDDFRTEILSLLKAQMVKNAVIVPVGAKGGFFPKQLPPPTDREAFLTEGREAYKVFVRTLLSVTDNRVGEEIVPPTGVVRLDGDDPYFVVAADKGTATFSDTANAISLDAGFWLGDAFASGGSQGYDHKKMGITARGAWISVERHFREMGSMSPSIRSTSSGSATCRAMSSVTACCSAGRSGWWRRSTTATSSLTPIRIRRRALPSGSGCSICRARPGRIITRA